MRTFLDYVGVELVGLQSVFPPDPWYDLMAVKKICI
jgi:hypothetical protein